MSSAVIKSIPLSNNTVQRRVDEMATDIKDMICNIIRNTEFSLQLHESTLPGKDRGTATGIYSLCVRWSLA